MAILQGQGSFLGSGRFSASPSPPKPQTWDPATHSPSITLSNGNLTGTHTGGGGQVSCLARALFPSGANKYYWETTVAGTGFTTDLAGVGIANGTINLGSYVGSNTNSLGFFTTSAGDGFYYNGAGVLATPNLTSSALTTAGGLICIAWDNVNSLLWVRFGTTGNWNGSATANPATQAGGCSINSGLFTAGNVGPAFNTDLNVTPDSVVAAFAPASWQGTAPSGFVAFDPAAGGPTTWQGQANIAGSGVLGAAAGALLAASAVFAGSGGLTANAAQLTLAANFAGTGNLATSPAALLTASASFVGVGGFPAGASVPEQFGAATFSGSGSFTASIAPIPWLASAAFAGSGAFSAVEFGPQQFAAAGFAGVGGFVASPAELLAASTALTGTGAISASPAAALVASAIFSGAGSFPATASVPEQFASATFAGAGSLTAAGRQLAVAGASFAGVGAFTAAPATLLKAAGAFSGAGAFSARESGSFAASFVGASGFLASPRMLLAAGSAFAGAVSLSTSPSGLSAAAAQFSGVGAFSSTAVPQQFGAFAAAGNSVVIASPAATLAAGAKFVGSGALSAGISAPPGVQWFGSADFKGVANWLATVVLPAVQQFGAAEFIAIGQFSASARVKTLPLGHNIFVSPPLSLPIATVSFGINPQIPPQLNEPGVTLYFSVEGLTDAMTLYFTKPSGAVYEGTPEVIYLRRGSPSAPLGSFDRTTYLVYTFAAGELDELGLWSVAAGLGGVVSEPGFFTVVRNVSMRAA